MSVNCEDRKLFYNILRTKFDSLELDDDFEPTTHLKIEFDPREMYLDLSKWYCDSEILIPPFIGKKDKLIRLGDNEQESSITNLEMLKVEDLMKLDVTAGLSAKGSLEKKLSENQRKKASRLERAKTAGKDWYNLKKTEINEDLELELLAADLNEKMHLKSTGKQKSYGEHFEIGRIVAPAKDYYSDREGVSNKKLDPTRLGFVDSLLENQEVKKRVMKHIHKVESKKRKKK